MREVLSRFEESPERQDAIRYAADKLDLPKETQAGLAPRVSASATGRVSARLLDAGERLEQNALAGVAAHPALVPRARRARARSTSTASSTGACVTQLVSGGEPDERLVGLVAELDARATSKRIDERTAEQLLARPPRTRRIKRELSDADPARTDGVASLARQDPRRCRGISPPHKQFSR